MHESIEWTHPCGRVWMVVVLPSHYEKQDCFLARALEIIGERWTLLVLRDAFYGVRRFGDFHAHLDMPRTVLSNRLRGLVAAGVMTKVPDPQHSGRHLYELTEQGRALWPALYALRAWGERIADDSCERRRRFVHDACGQPLGATASCERCAVLPPPEHVLVVAEGQPPNDARTDPVALELQRPHRLLDPIPALYTSAATDDAVAAR